MVAILSDIANFISGAIQWLTQSAPKAFRIIFFLVLLTLGALLMTFTIRMMGYHCNSEGVPYTVSALNIFGNWDLLTSVPDVESLQNQAYDANQLPQDVTGGSNINNCGLQYDTGSYTLNTGEVINFDTPTYFFDGKYCTACTLVKVNHGQALFGGELNDELCLGNVYRMNVQNMSWTQRNLYCGTSGYCQPPLGFYWRQTDNKYVCNDLTICGGTSMSVAKYWDKKIIAAGGKPLYPAGFQQDASTDKVFSIQCTTDLKAQFTIWSIPIFDPTIWLVLTVVIGLFSFYKWHGN